MFKTKTTQKTKKDEQHGPHKNQGAREEKAVLGC
jgi:hypothetical protein